MGIILFYSTPFAVDFHTICAMFKHTSRPNTVTLFSTIIARLSNHREISYGVAMPNTNITFLATPKSDGIPCQKPSRQPSLPSTEEQLQCKICDTPDAKPKICVTPDANPRRQSVEYRWRWAFWRWGWRCAGTFQVVCVNFICVL